MRGPDAGEPLKWRLLLKLNRLLRRGDDFCWRCGSRWDGKRCSICGLEVLASGALESVPTSYDPEQAVLASAIEEVLAAHSRSPFLLARKGWRRGLAVQCAFAALQALGRLSTGEKHS